MNSATTRFTSLMGSVSLLTLTNVLAAHAQMVAQAQMAQATPETIPEQVLVTGSLIHGTAAVGVPVTNLGVQDFTETGNTTIGDLFRTVPEANVAPGPSAVNSNAQNERELRVNIRGLDAQGPRSLLMIDGIRHPPQADGLCGIDPSFIPALALDRVDVLADGASATYGSDAIAGVVNVILKRGFDGAVTLLHVGQPTDGGGTQYQASQMWGKTWDGGDITLTYEWTDEQAISGKTHSLFTLNYLPWGEQDKSLPLAASIPGTISTGAPTVTGFPTAPAPGALGLPGIVCTNCWSVPRGTGANFNASLNNGVGPLVGSSAATLNWATLTANAANQGANNFVDPLKMGWELAPQQKNALVATFDQRLLPNVSLFAEGYYTDRRVEEKFPAFGGMGPQNTLISVTVPTTNPYYPAGAPAGLHVAYDLAAEFPPSVPAFEVSGRFMGGFNLDLPFAWSGKIYGSHTIEEDQFIRHIVSTAGVNVALGNTAGGVTKPANVPYLNVFCDPRAFQCNSPATLAYIQATTEVGVKYHIDEYGGTFDGPLFDVPAGQVKAAVGALYDLNWVDGYSSNNQGTPGNPPTPLTEDIEPFQNWAAFTQLDVPVFGDNFNLPFVRRLDLEPSWRHDTYLGNPFLTGTTNNAKMAFNWLVDDLTGTTIRGSWGTSFRFANEGEFSEVLSPVVSSYNITGGTLGTALVQCGSNGQPTAGSAAAALFTAGFGCGSAPGGTAFGGAPTPLMRLYTNPAGQPSVREGGLSLLPEKGINYSAGFEFAPQLDLLRGLDLQATWYSVRIKGTIGTNVLNAGTLGDPTQRYHIILPSDLGCPVADNANPTLCPPFENMVLGTLTDPQSTSSASQLTNVYWINDSGTTNAGFLHVNGVDWGGSYNFDLGDLGAWNTGITGTYYLHRWSQTVTGGPIIDQLHQNLSGAGGVAQNGVETLPKMRWRARLGWSDGQYTATLFANYVSHYFAATEATPANVNFQCVAAGGTVGGGTFPCAISNFTQFLPAFYTFDLSLGYNTGDLPASDYLKRLTLQLVIQNLTGKHPSQEYGAGGGPRGAAGYDVIEPAEGRVIGVTIVKNW
ncbi:MAG TPA: TonB-dependent receptor plug domain-containing protein [Micropepsaceae bacterium]|nr:TonB-dependent receptor plug domain-containing protein [Micropepsaceae bacterium]